MNRGEMIVEPLALCSPNKIFLGVCAENDRIGGKLYVRPCQNGG